MAGSRLCQLGVSSRSESQRSRRQEFATSPRSSTTWSIDRPPRKWLAARPACPAPMTTVVVRSMAWPSGDFDGDVRRIREGVEHGGALLGLGDQRLDLLPRRVRVDGERHLDVVEAVADVAVGPEDPADVVRALDRRLDRAQLDAAVLRDGRYTPGQAAGQADEEVLDRRDAVVLRREDLGVVRFERPLLVVALLLAEAEEALDLHRAVDAALPLGGRAPGELSGLGRGLQRVTRLEQRLDVDSVGDLGHVAVPPSGLDQFPMEMVDNILAGPGYHSPHGGASPDARGRLGRHGRNTVP